MRRLEAKGINVIPIVGLRYSLLRLFMIAGQDTLLNINSKGLDRDERCLKLLTSTGSLLCIS